MRAGVYVEMRSERYCVQSAIVHDTMHERQELDSLCYGEPVKFAERRCHASMVPTVDTQDDTQILYLGHTYSSSLDKPQAVCGDKDGSLHCLCYQHIAVGQRDVDYICRAGEMAQHIPPEKHPPCPGNMLAG